MIKNSSKPSDGYSESPSSRPMTLRQQLAAIEHERWADWQKWCHKILRENLGNDNIELERVLERWEVQIATPYKMLSDAEKASDMEQVDRYWPLIERYCQGIAREARHQTVIDIRDASSVDLGTDGEVTGGSYIFTAEQRDLLNDMAKALTQEGGTLGGLEEVSDEK
jgi:hypothetical protein